MSDDMNHQIDQSPVDVDRLAIIVFHNKWFQKVKNQYKKD